MQGGELEKYYAREIMEAFSGRLRDEANLTALQNKLEMVVVDTMHPKHVSPWLCPDLSPRSASPNRDGG